MLVPEFTCDDCGEEGTADHVCACGKALGESGFDCDDCGSKSVGVLLEGKYPFCPSCVKNGVPFMSPNES